MNTRAIDNGDQASGKRTARRCTDCNAIPEDGAYRHARGCPLFHQLDAINRDDAAWLAAHPGEIRERALTAAERAEFVMLNGRNPSTDQVVVGRHGNYRVRMLRGAPSATPQAYAVALEGPFEEALRRAVTARRQEIEEFDSGDRATLILPAGGDDHACAVCAGVFPEPVSQVCVPCQLSADDERTVLVMLGICAGCNADLASRSEAVQ